MWPINAETAEIFGLLFSRCLGFYIAGPLFAQRTIPSQIKLLLAVVTSLALMPLVTTAGPPPADLWGFGLAVAGETFAGLLLGFAATLPIAGIRLGASLVGIQMGFGIVNVIDPKEGGQSPILSRFYHMLALVLFLLLNGHHLLIRALGVSLELVPLGGAQLSTGLAGHLIGLAGTMFLTALAVGGPLIAVLFLADAALGFVARTVPQMNIFIVGFPIKIALGLLGIGLTLPYFFRTVEELISGLERDFLVLLAGM